MNLKKCLEVGLECGLTTLGECYNNILVHAPSLFSYDDISKEMDELESEIKQIRAHRMELDEHTPAKSLLDGLGKYCKTLEEAEAYAAGCDKN